MLCVDLFNGKIGIWFEIEIKEVESYMFVLVMYESGDICKVVKDGLDVIC